MYVISVSHSKGGVAKTTTAVSLGSALAMQSQNVLLIDLDPQCSLSLLVGIDQQKSNRSIAHVLFGPLSIFYAAQPTIVPGMDIIISHPNLDMAERHLTTRKNYPYLMRQNLREIQKKYAFVIIDCAPYLGSITLNAMVASNLVIIPTVPEMLSITGMSRIMDWIRYAQQKFNPYLHYHVLITMLDKRNKSHNLIAEKLREKLGKELYQTEIGVDTKVRESQIARKPVLVHAPRTRATQQYWALAQEVMDYVERRTE